MQIGYSGKKDFVTKQPQKEKKEEKKEDEIILSWPGNCFCAQFQDNARQSVYF